MDSSRVRLQVSSRHVSRLKGQPSLHDMWRRITNNGWYTLNELNGRLTGAEHIEAFSPIDHPTDAQIEALAGLKATVGAVEQAIDFINFALALAGGGAPVFDSVRDGFRALFQAAKWLEAEAANTRQSLVLNAVAQIAGHPFRYLKEGAEDELLVLESAPVWFAGADEQFDVFISYKHREYSAEVEQLAAALKSRGVKIWLDREQMKPPSGGRFAREELVRRLIDGIQRSKMMVFFETYDSAIADEDYRGRKRVFNYQIMEQRYGSEIAILRPKKMTLDISLHASIPFTGWDDLAAKLAARVQRTPAGARVVRGLDPRPIEPRFDEAAAVANAQARDYFGRALPLSPQATAALLAPCGEPNMSPLGDDILIELLRHSAWAARALTTAGIDAENIFRVGAQAVSSRWETPGHYCLRDVFGHDRAHHPPADDLVDEARLLLGILGYAADGAKAAELLDRSWRLSEETQRGESEDHTERTATSGRAYRDVCAAFERSGRPAFPDQQWEIWREVGRLRIRPCASCGVWKLSDSRPGAGNQKKPVSLVVRQSTLFYRVDEVRTLEDLINAGATDELDAFLQRFPHLCMALPTSEATLVGAIDITPDFLDQSQITMHPIESQSLASAPRESMSARWLREALSLAERHLIEPSETTDVGVFKLRSRPVMVLGSPPRPQDDRVEDDDPAFVDLAISVLPGLWRYLCVRDLDASILGA